MNLKTIIIDTQAELLLVSLQQWNPEIEILGTYDDGLSGLAAIKEQMPDIALVNIDITGLRALETYGLQDQSSTELIFISEWATYAYEAIQFGALDFLLKPFQEQDIQRALKRAAQKTQNKRVVKTVYPIIKNLLPRMPASLLGTQHYGATEFLPVW